MSCDSVDLLDSRLDSDLRLTDVQSDTLPLETIYHILGFLDPQDLIRIQVVSRRFRAIVHDPTLWRTVYASARLLLPPGPFSWQSTRFLQRTLVHSARLAHTWTTASPMVLSRTVYPVPQSTDRNDLNDLNDVRVQWLRGGRWVIVRTNRWQLSVSDVETGATRVLWDREPFAHWSATSMMSTQGYLVYVAVNLRRGNIANPVKLLEFVVDNDTGHLSDSDAFDVPTWCMPTEAFTPRVRVDCGFAPYVFISLSPTGRPRHSLVFDPQRRQFFKFPRFRTRLDVLLDDRGRWFPHLVEVYFTRTHVFVLSRAYLNYNNVGPIEVVQTFALPDPDPDIDSNSGLPNISESVPVSSATDDAHAHVRSTIGELRLTHEMATQDLASVWLTPIRDATVDPATQATTLRFMHACSPIEPAASDVPVRLVCTDYILPAVRTGPMTDIPADQPHRHREHNNNDLNAIVRSTHDVLPIITVSHEIASVRGTWRDNLVDASRDGFVRGLCVVEWPRSPAGEVEWFVTPDEMAYKFTVDATGARCVAVIGNPSPSCADLYPSRSHDSGCVLDGVRGRTCYVKRDVRESDVEGEPTVLAILAYFT